MSRILLATVFSSLALSASAGWNPRDYIMETATCQALDRTQDQQVNIQLRYFDINPTAEKTLLMVHGWPSLSFSWKSQIEEFMSEYRIIALDVRGFGASEFPGDIEVNGAIPDLIEDVACILDHAGVTEPSVCIAHDWGCQVCYETARTKAERVSAVVGLSIPYQPYTSDYLTTTDLSHLVSHLSYQAYLDNHTEDAEKELSADVRRSLRSTWRTAASPPPADFLASTTSYLGAWANYTEIPTIPFFSADEEDYLVEQYEIQAFTKNNFWYQDANRRRAWEAYQNQSADLHIINQPVLAIFPTQDPVANWTELAAEIGASDIIPNYTELMLPGAHWPHLETPDAVNSMLRDFFTKL